MNQFLSNKIIAGIVALALLVGVGVLVSSGDTSSTTRNAALVVATPCTKPGQVTKVSKQSVVCATTNTGSLWYATMKAKGKAQACTTPGAIRKKSDIVWVCGVVKKKKLWQATQPLPPAVVASTTGIEPGATQPTPALDSTQVATPDAPVVADNKDLADPKIPDDKTATQVIDTAATQTLAPAVPAALSLRTQPLGGVNAVALATQPVVQLLDQRGASIATAGITITAVSGRADVVLSGNTAVTDDAGRATFTTLSLTGKMGDITLTFTTPGLDGITSDKFVLAAGAATRLVNNTNIGSVVSGKAFDQQPVLHLEDSSANVIAVLGVEVIVASSTQGLSGTTTAATNRNGTAGFTGLALTKAGATTLTFTSGELSTTTEVTVVAGNYTTVKITTEASQAATNNTALAIQPVVQLFDANNNTVTTKDITVTARITQFPTADTAKAATLLFPTTAKTNAQGIATFTGLGIKGLIGAYTLGFTPTNGVTQASEKTTTLSAGVTTQLIVLTAAVGPMGDDALGTWSLTQKPVIGLRDISNNPVLTSGVTVTATVTGQTQTSTAQTNAQGEATIQIVFNGDNAGGRTITYSALSLQTAPTTINLKKLTPVVQAWVLPRRMKSSASFILTPPSSTSNGAWSYTSSSTTYAEVTSTGQVRLKGVPGTTKFTATQTSTTKYESGSQNIADLVTTDGYNIGEPGPGGGIVFYVATTPFTCGEDPNATSAPKCTYLEAAIANGTTTSAWTPTTTAQWGCYETSVPGTSLEIGQGRANTKIITDKTCKGTNDNQIAASIAAAYNGGGKTDWFLPSRKELDALCSEFFKGRTGVDNSADTCMGSGNSNAVSGTTNGISWSFAADYYWSSSEYSAGSAWGQNFSNGSQSYNYKGNDLYVRPVRAFSQTCATGGTCKVGDTGPGGGKVFYVHPSSTFASPGSDCGTACKYLEAALSDQGGDIRWCSDAETGLGVTDQVIGSGMSNTTKADNTCTLGAIQVAADYDNNNKTDWHLPSRNELNQLYDQKSTVGGFADYGYWSSSENGGNLAWLQRFSNRSETNQYKSFSYYVRPVRAF
jgi:Protein of unknown function (DUF1566)